MWWFSKRGWGMAGGGRQGWMGEGGRNAHPEIPWFACRQALYSSFQHWHNEHSIEELTSHVKPLPVWLKRKKEGLYLLMIRGKNKTYSVFDWYGWEEDFPVQIFLVMHKEKMSMLDPLFRWRDIVAYPGRGQWAHEMSISDNGKGNRLQCRQTQRPPSTQLHPVSLPPL